MRAKITYCTLAAVLVVYFVLVGSRGVLLIQQGTLVTVAFGIAVLVLPLIGVWFLWHTTRFARDAGRLARELEAEGGLPPDELRRTPSGRIDRASADEVFDRRRIEAERDPDDWRVWFRLAVAYHDARDTPRARTTMQYAIALHDGRAGGKRAAPRVPEDEPASDGAEPGPTLNPRG
ncbi:tetratricopeptide repeat protein [Streptomyces sp. AJS327]|uniref:tetratricopeptide repeat protein n=1 Tax=Streptomyces sp. AJS327 TaxID=2545265 RepID=UPI0027E4E86C|nr:tetratricopeptide repeat protein [Streptomyces sp. AJS327]